MILGPSPKLGPSARRWIDPLGMVAIMGLGVTWARLDGQSRLLYRGGFWLTELACLALITCAVTPGSLVARALSWRPFTFAGSISYGVYLWHWPIDCALTPQRVHVGPAALLALRLSATLLVSLASYRWIEQPIRSRGLPFGRPLIVVPASFALAVLAVVVGTRARPGTEPPSASPGTGEPALIPRPDLFQVMVLGDSTANSLGWCLRGLQEPGVTVHLLGRDGCTMLADTCHGLRWKEYSSTLQPNATLVFLGGAFMHGLHLHDEWHKACYPELDGIFEKTLQTRLEDLRSTVDRIWAVTLPYALGPWDSPEYRAEVDCINASIRKSARAVPTVRILDLAERLCPKGVCEREYHGAEIRPDGVHYSMEGAAGLSRWVLDEIQQ